MADTPIKRCVIYTRKSSEEGLEQDYNSLHAQREACEAFVRSQTGEGWRPIKTAYDDGGFSGGSMERPALQRLLEDIRRNLIDVVVVYKVDRLTRALADFARMVELFDNQSVSFVAVTMVEVVAESVPIRLAPIATTLAAWSRTLRLAPVEPAAAVAVPVKPSVVESVPALEVTATEEEEPVFLLVITS